MLISVSTLNLACAYYLLVSSQMNLVFVFLADDTAGRDRKHHTKDFDDLPTKAQNKHGQIFAME